MGSEIAVEALRSLLNQDSALHAPAEQHLVHAGKLDRRIELVLVLLRRILPPLHIVSEIQVDLNRLLLPVDGVPMFRITEQL